MLETLHLQHVVHLLGGQRALQLLPAQQLRLDLVKRLLLAWWRGRDILLCKAAGEPKGPRPVSNPLRGCFGVRNIDPRLERLSSGLVARLDGRPVLLTRLRAVFRERLSALAVAAAEARRDLHVHVPCA